MGRRSVKVEWLGVEELKKTLATVGNQLDDRTPEIKDIILGPSEKAMDAARAFAPVKTGLLRRSIYATKGGPKQRGVLMGVRRSKNRAWYARFVEFGTVKMAAHPFFRPAILQMFSNYVPDILPGIKALVERTAAQNAYHPPG